MFRWAGHHKFGIMMVVWLVTLAAWGIDHLRDWMDRGFVNRSRRTLLYDIDHEVIRRECRRLLTEARQKPDASSRPRFDSGEVPPPPALKLLKPSIVSVEPHEGSVTIMFGGGFHHWFLRYFDDVAAGRGTRDLGEGLWYDDEGGLPGQ